LFVSVFTNNKPQKKKPQALRYKAFFFLQPFIIKGVYLIGRQIGNPFLYFGYLSFKSSSSKKAGFFFEYSLNS